MEEVGFVSTGMSWTGGSWFCIDWSVLDQRKSVWHRLERFGMKEVGFTVGQRQTICNGPEKEKEEKEEKEKEKEEICSS